MYNPYMTSDTQYNNVVHPTLETSSRMKMHDLVDEYFYNTDDDLDGIEGIDYGLNYIIESSSSDFGYKVVDTYDEFEAYQNVDNGISDVPSMKEDVVAFYNNYGIYYLWGFIPVEVAVQDPHPTAVGQQLIFDYHWAKYLE
jgi:hypothetical protein